MNQAASDELQERRETLEKEYKERRREDLKHGNRREKDAQEREMAATREELLLLFFFFSGSIFTTYGGRIFGDCEFTKDCEITKDRSYYVAVIV